MTISSEGWFGLKAITIIPIGEVEEQTLEELTSELERILEIKTETGEGFPLPEHAYNKSRDQYYSAEIIKLLKDIHPFHLAPILGVTESDLYTSDLNFIFGEADPLSQTAIISLKRLREEYYGRPKNKKLYLERAVKEALHELGHGYGLGHCPDPSCIMHFSNRLEDTDRKGPGFCKKCQATLRKRQ